MWNLVQLPYDYNNLLTLYGPPPKIYQEKNSSVNSLGDFYGVRRKVAVEEWNYHHCDVGGLMGYPNTVPVLFLPNLHLPFTTQH